MKWHKVKVNKCKVNLWSARMNAKEWNQNCNESKAKEQWVNGVHKLLKTNKNELDAIEMT